MLLSEHDLDELVRTIVDDAPPLPENVVQILTNAIGGDADAS